MALWAEAHADLRIRLQLLLADGESTADHQALAEAVAVTMDGCSVEDARDIRLMLACLGEQHPGAVEELPQPLQSEATIMNGADAPPPVIDEAQPLIGHWKEFVALLHTLSDAAVEWSPGAWETFSVQVEELVRQRRAAPERARAQLDSALETLRAEEADALAFFGFADVASWSAAGCDAGQVQLYGEQVFAFQAALRARRELEGSTPASTVQESRQRRQTQDQLEEQIIQLHEALAAVLSIPATDSPAPQSGISDEEPVLAEPALGTKGVLEIPEDLSDADESPDVRANLDGVALAQPADGQEPAPDPEAVDQPALLAELAELDQEPPQPGDSHQVAEEEAAPRAVAPKQMAASESAEDVRSAPDDLGDLLDELEPINYGHGDTPVVSPYEDLTEPSETVAQAESTDSDQLPTCPEHPIDERGLPASPPEGIAERIAYEILAGQISNRPAALELVVWQLLHDGAGGLAYHLARALTAAGPWSIQPELLRAVTLGATVRYDIGDTAALLKHDFSLLNPINSEQLEEPVAHACCLLYTAASLRASLLAPNTGAYTILQTLPQRAGLAQLYAYCQAVASYGSTTLQPLDTTTLRVVRDNASWHAELDALRREVRQWSSQATERTIKYPRASRVWWRWQRPNGLIARLMQPIVQHDVTQIDVVRAEAERLSDSETVRRAVNFTDMKELGQSKHGSEEITGAALATLRQYSAQALEFARRWVALYDGRPENRQGFVQKQVDQLREEVTRLHGPVMAELQALAQHYARLPRILAAAISCCEHAVNQIASMFDTSLELPSEEIPPRIVLGLDVLRTTALSTNDEWTPEDDEALVDGLLRATLNRRQPWENILAAWSELRDHEATARILAGLEATAADPPTLDQLSRLRAQHLAECCAALRRDIEETRRQIEGAVAYGLLRETDRLVLVAEIQRIENELPALRRFAAAHERLAQIRSGIERERQERVADARERLKGAQIAPAHPAYRRIEAVLDAGDALAANEYIDMVGAGQPLPDQEPTVDIFTAFFPPAVHDLARFLEDTNAPRFIERTIGEIREFARGRLRGYRVANLESQNVAGPQAAQAAELLAAWFEIKQARRLDLRLASRIVETLGFSGAQLAPGQPGRLARYRLTTRPVQNKSLCPTWLYGSHAQGHYHLLCAWERPTESEIVSELEELAHEEPAIMFYFGRMTEPRRRELARLTREQHRTCLLVDDLLILYLATLPSPRMPHLFDCALPFTYLDPYTTTAGIVPTEMFYGRRHERAQILDPMGSCFIYGGRQLGKTALLRDVERDYHNPEAGRVVVWIDLKVEGIGNERTIDALWGVLTRELRRHGVVPASTSLHISEERLLEHTFSWLSADPTRRVLLLLDEADRFLESDGREEFRRASKIKGLMDRTNRRFKVVFAGLHNVKRTTRQSNHPLAHYGDPICIGPLLDNGEWREARALIERPMASAGYRFESPDLVTRILSQTNYYPSLIQLYCKQLIKHLTNPHTPLAGPPYTVTSKHVEDVYQSSDLRAAIRQRFDLTIQLDTRYEVIAYVVAFWSLLDEGRGMVEGFPESLIREQVLATWPEGFRESDGEDVFLALLDEMVGLGILRHVRDHYFALRSPNVVLLMGTDEEISAKLDRRREPPVEYEPDTFRVAYRDEGRDGAVDHARRSPLTALQEAELHPRANGVSIIAGCRAAGRDDLTAFLKLAYGPEYLLQPTFPADRAGFKREIARVLAGRADGGATVVLVPTHVAWSEAWVADAQEVVHNLRSRTAWARVVFVAEPTTLWQILRSDHDDAGSQLVAGVSTLSLRPWHDNALRQWLEDCGFPATDPQQRAAISAVTGNWPWLLQEFYRATRADTRYAEHALRDLSQRLEHESLHADVVHQFELRVSEPLQVLRCIVEWAGNAPMEITDLIEVLQGQMTVERIHQSLRWADMLSLARPTTKGAWRVDPLLARLLMAMVR